MFGSHGGGQKPQAPMYVSPPAYTNVPNYIQPNPAQSPLNSYVPQVQNPGFITAQSLGVQDTGSAERNLEEYAPWLSLQNNPMDSQNMQKADNYYQQMYGLPQLSYDQSAFQNNGQGGSSYAGAYLGQETAMNNLQGFQAALQQQQQEFNNALNARQSLFSGPIALQQNQNAADVGRALGIAGLDYSNTANQNQYNLANNQGLNSYNLGANENRNAFNSGIYGTQAGIYNNQQNNATQRGIGTMNALDSAFHTVVGNNGLF